MHRARRYFSMHKPSILLSALVIISCSNQPIEPSLASVDTYLNVNENLDSTETDTIHLDKKFAPRFSVIIEDTVAYSVRKKEAEILRSRLNTAYNNKTIPIDSVGVAFEDFLVNRIIPHWYGTPWDYEGHTDTPGEGEVACGYLVSTTLRHMNVQINRYHLAQQAASNGAKSLAINFDHISSYSEIADFENTIENGIYMVGLSYHVGFLLKKNNKLYFIHSNYMGDVCVMIENAHQSEALASSGIFVLVRIGNPDLMKAWLNKSDIKVYRE